MATQLSMDELRNMNLTDLRREIREGSTLLAKLRLGIKMKKEKDTARYRREKRQLARMQTALTQKCSADAPHSPAIS
ncbi:50S ribosomal protein L29 [Candidatus Peregrinibacteria bacterium CG10_big_fil_rev_8_21_14_0_10_55_24]|nr:MAG: 50S ribosomal protein L29 [Candidatus Peregrinibacteria bacterium CG10_big_fil_rev_8_21_14_0_10_55_24]